MSIYKIEKFKFNLLNDLIKKFNLQPITYPYLTNFKFNPNQRTINFDNKVNMEIYQLNL